MGEKTLSEEECNSCFERIAKRSPDSVELESEFVELRKYEIPALLKESLNEAIYCYIFRAYLASIVICRSFVEASLKHLVIRKCTRNSLHTPRLDRIKANVSKSTLFQLENCCDLLEVLNEEDRRKIRAIRILGNIHVHGAYERRNKEYLQNEEIRTKVIELLKAEKILAFLWHPKLAYMELLPEEIPEEMIQISHDELEWFSEQYPDVVARRGVKDMSLFALRTTFDLIKTIFQKRSSLD
ncbi:MAG: DUF4145 domain-containing protein [Candidatus Bathyarchaeota archaeon]|nr:DUF4145 domain-containing protein [Candidatus Bathyarchaeota archaeon]